MRSPNAIGPTGVGAGLELIVGDGGAFDGAPDQIAVQTVGQVAAIEPVGPFPKVARQVLGTDPVMGTDEPGFDVAEQRMDDREELAGVGAAVLDHRGVLEVLAEGGIATAIAGEAIGQEVRLGCDIGLEKGAEFSARRRRQHGDPGVAGEEAVLALDRMPVSSLLVLRRRHLLDGGDDQSFVGAGGASPATCRTAATADEGLIRLQQAAQRARRVLTQPVAQLVRHGPSRLIRHPQLPLQKLGRDAALVAGHQVGGKKPLRQIRPRPVKHRSGGDRFLPVARAAFVNPRTRLQPPSLSPAAPGAHKTARPAQLGQVRNALLLCSEPSRKLQEPAHPKPPQPTRRCYPEFSQHTRTFREPVLPGEGY